MAKYWLFLFFMVAVTALDLWLPLSGGKLGAPSAGIFKYG
ncbi:protein of unknown function [Xenorhabdus poinarii G6]|uniref:Uncharacterized protein n=1 Tax=Xenorhabdus poinarii G6 TaxID=1354304 RepID=A0A068QYV4_9GAMM|nr:protein of unknown function [Xenorhabdus poinarii G6]